MTNYNKIVVIIFVALLALPLAQGFLGWLPEVKLTGELAPLVRPAVTRHNWLNGELQQYAEALLERKIGLRGLFVRSDNQLNYWLFGELHQKTKTRLVVGKEHYLFEQNYIDSYLGNDRIDQDKVVAQVRQLKLLQDSLAAQQKAFLLVIAPSKASFYSQYIPDSQLGVNGQENLSYNYLAFVKELNKQQVNYWDGRQYFADERAVAKAPLFAKAGTHWTVYGSCLATKQILENLGKQLKANYVLPDCDSVDWSAKPLGQDADLVELANLWLTGDFEQQLAYPRSQKDIATNQLDLLMVGDSFAWNLLKQFKNGPLLKSYNFGYYFNTLYSFPDNKTKPMPRQGAKLLQLVRASQAVVIEVNESGLTDVGFGLPQAVFQLENR